MNDYQDEYGAKKMAKHALIGVLVAGIVRKFFKPKNFLAFLGVCFLIHLATNGPDKDKAMQTVPISTVEVLSASPSPEGIVTLEVRNSGSGRIFMPNFTCTYATPPNPAFDPPTTTLKFRTESYFGHVNPGETKVIKSESYDGTAKVLKGGYSDFKCEVHERQVEASDVYRSVGRPDLAVLSQLEVKLNYRQTEKAVNGWKYRVLVNGTVKNNSSVVLRSVTVDCYAANMMTIEQDHFLTPVIANPGETVAFSGQTKLMDGASPTQGFDRMFCRASHAGQ